MKVPFVDLRAQYASIKQAVDSAMSAVVEATAFIGGAELRAFEHRFAELHHVKHCIGVGNGTDALFVILRSLGIGPGDAVITAANSFIASSEAISLTGARPVFVDCNEDYTMDVNALRRALERRRTDVRVRAILPVHLYGRVCNMTEIAALAREFDCAIVEDCAQAHIAMRDGRRVGSFGCAGAFSFYPGKNLGAYGDAGGVVTGDDALAERMRMFANHGRKEKYDHLVEGINSRLDNLQAAVLNVKLDSLEAWTRARIRVADRYRTELRGVDDLVLPSEAADLGHVYHLFVVRTKQRDRLRIRLKELGVDTGVHYPSALPDLPAYRHLREGAEDTPRASAYASEILSLPMFPELSDEQVDHVIRSVRTAIQSS